VSDAPRSDAPLTPRFALGATALVVGVHLALWAQAAAKRGESFAALLDHWDGGHYAAIAREGYDGSRWVFYPAYPLLVRGLSALLYVSAVEWVGFGLSLSLVRLFAWLVARAAARPGLPDGVAPGTRLGFLVFALSPASYVFHSLHTESLFLALSFGAFFCAGTQRPLAAGLFAAACAVTRNQGVFVGLSAALLAASREPSRPRQLRALALTGGLALVGVAAFLVFELLAAGTPFAFVQAQGAWAHVDSPLGALKTLVFANPWQSTDGQNVARYVGWWLFVLGGAWLARRTPALGLYALLCFLVQLLQGELVNTWRFAAPVFPLFFFAGDELAKRPRWLRALVLAALVAVNLDTARRFALGLWAY
jgi:hypothetical protein